VGARYGHLRRRVPALHDFRDGACRNAGVAIPCCRHASVSACASASASWACPRLKIAQRTSVPKASSSVTSMYTRELCTRSHVEVSASLGCGFQSVRAAPTSEFPHRRLRGEHCLHHLRGGCAGRRDRRNDVRRMLLHGGNSRCLPGARFGAAARWSCGVWQATATHHSPLEPASWSNSVVWRKPFWPRTVTGLSSYPLFVPSPRVSLIFFCQTNCQPTCFMGLSAALVLAAIECPKDLVFVSTDVHAGVFHSQSRRSQRFLGLWFRVHAGVFHVGVSTPTFTMPAHGGSPR